MNSSHLLVTWVLPHRTRTVAVVESVLFLGNATVALLGNGLVCLAVYRNSRLRNTTNLFITSLALTDMLTASICHALTSGVLITGRWLYGPEACAFFGFFAHHLILCSVCTMTLTAISRYLRIIKPPLYKKIFTPNNSLVIIFSLWVSLALVAGLPVMLKTASFLFLPDFAGCGWYFHSEAANVGFNTLQCILCAIVPSVVIPVSYIKVSHTIRAHNANIHGALQGGGRISVEEIKVTKTLYVLVAGFALCWVPSFSIVLIARIVLSYTPHGVAFVMVYLLGLSSAINPFIYGVMSRPFRREFQKILCCGRKLKIQPVTANPIAARPPLE